MYRQGILPALSLLAHSLPAHAANPDTSGVNQNSATQAYLDRLNVELSRTFLYALIVLTFLVFVYRNTIRFNAHVRHLISLNGTPGALRYYAIASPWLCWLKDHLLYAPLFHRRRAAEIKLSEHINLGTIPTRAQSLFILFVIIYNIFACVWNIPWADQQLEVLPILRSRAGTIATVNLVPIVVMATIKNPLINALDISYDSFNLMHRWLGRLCILEAFTHVISHVVSKVRTKGEGWSALTHSLQTSPFIQVGFVAILGTIGLLLHSPKVFRSLGYEFFLHSHLIFVGIFFGGLWHHLETYYQKWMLFAAIILWGGARLWRFATMFYRSVGRDGCKAVIEAMPGEAMRIEFRTPRPWNFKSGQTIYLCIPSVGLWTSHPFSVAWSDFVQLDGQKAGQAGLVRSFSTRTVLSDDEKHRDKDEAPEIAVELRGKQSFSLIVRKKKGFTAKLWEQASQCEPGKPLVKNCFIEGPYGHAKSMSSYGSVILFASGVGITHQMPYVRDLVDGFAAGTVATRQVTLAWVVPSTECLEWVRPWMHEILAMDRRREVLRVFLYISRATLSHEIRSPSETVRMSRGRPDVMNIVRNACQEGIGCVGVSVCAGGGLSDEVRRVTRAVINQGYSADLVEEFFGW